MSVLPPIVPELAVLSDGQQCLVWRCASPCQQLSSAPVGGGSGLVDWVVNLQVAADYARRDLEVHAGEVANHLGLGGRGVTLLTAANVAAVTSAVEQGGVRADATVGISTPTWAAAEQSHDEMAGPGTINIVVQLPQALTVAAAVNAVMTVTEAKTQALIERGVDGTGTATDAVLVLWPAAARDAEPIQFAGPRSDWGGRIARVVHTAVGVGVDDWRSR